MLSKQLDVLPEYQGVLKINGSFVKGCYERASQVDTQYFGIKEDGGCWTSKNVVDDYIMMFGAGGAASISLNECFWWCPTDCLQINFNLHSD